MKKIGKLVKVLLVLCLSLGVFHGAKVSAADGGGSLKPLPEIVIERNEDKKETIYRSEDANWFANLSTVEIKTSLDRFEHTIFSLRNDEIFADYITISDKSMTVKDSIIERIDFDSAMIKLIFYSSGYKEYNPNESFFLENTEQEIAFEVSYRDGQISFTPRDAMHAKSWLENINEFIIFDEINKSWSARGLDGVDYKITDSAIEISQKNITESSWRSGTYSITLKSKGYRGIKAGPYEFTNIYKDVTDEVNVVDSSGDIVVSGPIDWLENIESIDFDVNGFYGGVHKESAVWHEFFRILENKLFISKSYFEEKDVPNGTMVLHMSSIGYIQLSKVVDSSITPIVKMDFDENTRNIIVTSLTDLWLDKIEDVLLTNDGYAYFVNSKFYEIKGNQLILPESVLEELSLVSGEYILEIRSTDFKNVSKTFTLTSPISQIEKVEIIDDIENQRIVIRAEQKWISNLYEINISNNNDASAYLHQANNNWSDYIELSLDGSEMYITKDLLIDNGLGTSTYSINLEATKYARYSHDNIQIQNTLRVPGMISDRREKDKTILTATEDWASGIIKIILKQNYDTYLLEINDTSTPYLQFSGGNVTIFDSLLNCFGLESGEYTLTVISKSYDLAHFGPYDMITVKTVVVPVNDISVLPIGPLQMQLGEMQELTATLNEDATNKIIEWVVEDSNILSIDAVGIMTALTVGTTTVYAIAKDGSEIKSNEVQVTVKNPNILDKAGVYTAVQAGDVHVMVDGVVLKDVKINGDLIIDANVGDGEITLHNVTITGNLIINGGGSNSVIIEQSYVEGKVVVNKDTVSGKQTVSIKANGTIFKQEIVLETGANIIIEGTKEAVTVTVKNKSGETSIVGEIQNLSIETSQPVIVNAVVDTITVQNIEPGKEASVSLANATIKKLVVDVSAVNTKISVSTDSKVNTLRIDAATEVSGKGLVSNAEINARNTKFEETPLTTKISETITDNSVVIKDKEYGNGTAQVIIAVRVISLSVTSKTTVDLIVGQTSTIEYLVNPTDADNKNVVFTSSNETIAKVSTLGVITGLAGGTSIITVKTVDGEFEKTITVSVKNISSGGSTAGGNSKPNPVIDAINGIKQLIEITLSIPESVDKAIISALKGKNKTLTYFIKNVANEMEYSWSLLGTDITQEKSFPLEITRTTPNKNAIELLLEGKPYVVANFSHKESLPGKATIKFAVNKVFANNDVVTIYQFNKAENKLDLVEKGVVIVDGYAFFAVKNGSEYVLVKADKAVVGKDLSYYSNGLFDIYANSRVVYSKQSNHLLTLKGYAFEAFKNYSKKDSIVRELIFLDKNDPSSPNKAFRVDLKATYDPYLNKNATLSPSGEYNYSYAYYGDTVNLNQVRVYKNPANSTKVRLPKGEYLVYIRLSDGKRSNITSLKNILSDVMLPASFAVENGTGNIIFTR